MRVYRTTLESRSTTRGGRCRTVDIDPIATLRFVLPVGPHQTAKDGDKVVEILVDLDLIEQILETVGFVGVRLSNNSFDRM